MKLSGCYHSRRIWRRRPTECDHHGRISLLFKLMGCCLQLVSVAAAAHVSPRVPLHRGRAVAPHARTRARGRVTPCGAVELVRGLGGLIERDGRGALRARCRAVRSIAPTPDRVVPRYASSLRGQILVLAKTPARRTNGWLAAPTRACSAHRGWILLYTFATANWPRPLITREACGHDSREVY